MQRWNTYTSLGYVVDIQLVLTIWCKARIKIQYYMWPWYLKPQGYVWLINCCWSHLSSFRCWVCGKEKAVKSNLLRLSNCTDYNRILINITPSGLVLQNFTLWWFRFLPKRLAKHYGLHGTVYAIRTNFNRFTVGYVSHSQRLFWEA